MRKIRIAFTDFWEGFDETNNYFLDILREKYEVEITNDKSRVDFVIYSSFGYEHLQYNCVRIYYTGENMVPDFNICDYAIGFEHMEYGDRYIRIPLYVVNYREDYKHMLEIRGRIQPREKFCSFVASNSAEADRMRKDLFDKLSAYVQVDAGGRYLNNIGEPNGVEDKQAFQEQYRFSMAVENSSSPGYCTEKIIQAFAAGTIPIYWGDPKVGEYFNEKAFVNCHNYRTIDEIVETVKEINENEIKYKEMLQQPVLEENEKTLQQYDDIFREWIYHIVDMPLETAYRRCHYGRQLVYTNLLMRWIRIEKEYTDFSNKSFIKKIYWLVKNRKKENKK